MTEFEKKIRLTKAEYHILKTYGGFSAPPLVQTNYYYDTPALEMNAQGVTCRIRQTPLTCQATVKSHSAHAVDVSLERSFPIADIPEQFPWPDRVLPLLGAMITIRLRHDCDNLTLFLDKSLYLDTKDYELEIEYPAGQELVAHTSLQHIAQLLTDHHVISDPCSLIQRAQYPKSKSVRFFDRQILIKERYGYDTFCYS